MCLLACLYNLKAVNQLIEEQARRNKELIDKINRLEAKSQAANPPPPPVPEKTRVEMLLETAMEKLDQTSNRMSLLEAEINKAKVSNANTEQHPKTVAPLGSQDGNCFGGEERPNGAADEELNDDFHGEEDDDESITTPSGLTVPLMESS